MESIGILGAPPVTPFEAGGQFDSEDAMPIGEPIDSRVGSLLIRPYMTASTFLHEMVCREHHAREALRQARRTRSTSAGNKMKTNRAPDNDKPAATSMTAA